MNEIKKISTQSQAILLFLFQLPRHLWRGYLIKNLWALAQVYRYKFWLKPIQFWTFIHGLKAVAINIDKILSIDYSDISGMYTSLQTAMRIL